MFKFAADSKSDIDEIIVRIEASSDRMLQALRGNADESMIHKLDEDIISDLYELSEKQLESREERQKIIEFALSRIENQIDFDTSILFYTKLIRKNLLS